jgi:Protein of unknown function (DUF732)
MPACEDIRQAGCASSVTLEDSGVMKRLLMLLSLPTMILAATSAYADPPSANDVDFLTNLTAAGLTYQDPAQAVAVAKGVCQLVDTGTPAPDIEKDLQQRNPSFSGNGATNFIILATGEYCPKYLSGDGGPAKPSGAEGNQAPRTP